MPRLTRSQELRVAGISLILIATVLGSAAAALLQHAAAPAAAPAVTPASVHLLAVDVVRPTPVALTFAKPQQHTPAARRPVAAAPVRPVVRRVTTRTVASACAGATPAERGQAAVASLVHGVPAGVTYSYGPGDGRLKGMTYFDTHHVDVYVASCARESDALLRHVVAHETGHAWDSLHMTDQLRADYLAARGIAPGTPWFGCNGCQDFATPAGDFAETYAQWQRQASDSRSTIAPAATPEQLADLGARFFS